MAITRDGGKCVKCDSEDRLQVHHKLYRKRWEDGVLEDVETLCFRCHGAEHGFNVYEPREFDILLSAIRNRMNRIERHNKEECLVRNDEIAKLSTLADGDLDLREIDNLIRQRGNMRTILTSRKMWESWLSKSREVKGRFWEWSVNKRKQMTSAAGIN